MQMAEVPMSKLETFLIPGEAALELLLFLFDIRPEAQDPQLITVFAGLLSFLFWLCVLRFVGMLALRILGLDRGGRY